MGKRSQVRAWALTAASSIMLSLLIHGCEPPAPPPPPPEPPVEAPVPAQPVEPPTPPPARPAEPEPEPTPMPVPVGDQTIRPENVSLSALTWKAQVVGGPRPGMGFLVVYQVSNLSDQYSYRVAIKDKNGAVVTFPARLNGQMLGIEQVVPGAGPDGNYQFALQLMEKKKDAPADQPAAAGKEEDWKLYHVFRSFTEKP